MHNPLTSAQEKYFSQSVVRDENNNLLVMYHGTGKNPLFNKVDYQKIGTSKGSGYGPGIYTTPDKHYCMLFYGNNDYNHVMAVYLDARNPLYINTRGSIGLKQWRQIIKMNNPKHKVRKVLAQILAQKELDIVKSSNITQIRNMIYKGYLTTAGYKRGLKAIKNHKLKVTFAHYLHAYQLISEKVGKKSDNEILVFVYETLKKAYPNFDVEHFNRTFMEVTGYDSVIKCSCSNPVKIDQLAVFTAEQIKATTNLIPERDHRIFGDYPIKSVKNLEEEKKLQ